MNISLDLMIVMSIVSPPQLAYPDLKFEHTSHPRACHKVIASF